MAGPSIKGTAFDSVLQDVRRLMDEGVLTREALEVALEPQELRYLDDKIAAASWYPIGCYARLLSLLCDTEAQGQPEAYLFKRGAIAAERLHAANIYPQLDASGKKLGLRVLPLVISIAGAIYNFTRWRFETDGSGDAFRVIVEDAKAYPNEARFAAEGFLQCTAERVTNRQVRVHSDRPTADSVVFHAVVEGQAS